jgi:hypothetical protein
VAPENGDSPSDANVQPACSSGLAKCAAMLGESRQGRLHLGALKN